MELLVLTPDDCLPLREELVHPGEPAEASKYASDRGEGALHLGFKVDEELLVVASILPERRDGMHEMWRVRGFAATADACERKLDAQLLNAVITIVKERGGGLWCQGAGVSRALGEGCGMAVHDDAGDDPEDEGDEKALLLTWKG